MPATRIAGGAAGGTNGATTPDANTTGGTLAVVAITSDNGAANPPTFTDSLGNTGYVALSATVASNCKVRLFYKLNPIVGPGHNIALSEVSSLCSIAFQVYGGGTFTYQTESAGNAIAGTTSITPGSVTPSTDGSLVLSSWCNAAGTISGLAIDSSYLIDQYSPYVGGSNYSAALASLIQSVAAAVNPTWSWGGSVDVAARQAVFLFSGGDGDDDVKPFERGFDGGLSRGLYA